MPVRFPFREDYARIILKGGIVMEFHDRLYEIRKKAGMTQSDLAEKLDVSRQAVSRWEMGTAKPEFENLIAISNIFDVSIDYLLKGDVVSADDYVKPTEEPEQAEETEKTNTAEKLWLAAIITFVVLAVVLTLASGDWNSGIFTAVVVTIALACLIGLICLVAYIVRLVLK